MKHIKRKFYDIVSTLDKETLKTTKAQIGFNYCEQFYLIEKDYEKRYKIRLEKTAPIINEFIDYVDKELLEACSKAH